MYLHWNEMTIRRLTAADNARIAEIARGNLKKFHLDLPGTAYFDPELDHLSTYYDAAPERRAYFVAADPCGRVVGGVGAAEFDGSAHCAEVQKLYLTDAAKGRGLGRELMRVIEDFARRAGYRQLYLETHTNLTAAIHLYERMGFQQIDRPAAVCHSTMDRFYQKML